MANWLNQLQSLLGQSSSSTSSSADQGLVKLLVPGALGGLLGCWSQINQHVNFLRNMAPTRYWLAAER